MSLLPKQILPQTVPFGTVVNGQVIIDQNWWLLLYNLCAQVLGGQATLPVSPAVTVTVTASPFTYQAQGSGLLAVTGGKVSFLSLSRASTAAQVGVAVELFPVVDGDTVKVIYEDAPSVIFFPFALASG